MKDSDFTKLLTRCSKAAAKHYDLMDQVNAECQRRYGCSYSDVDADQLIDQLDIHGGEGVLTAQYFDEQMQSCGKSRIDSVRVSPMIFKISEWRLGSTPFTRWPDGTVSATSKSHS